jgi:hypothetical protein
VERGGASSVEPGRHRRLGPHGAPHVVDRAELGGQEHVDL